MAKPVPMTVASASSAALTRRIAEQNAKAVESVMASGATGCPCCAGAA